jgi:hypothetical protein
MRQRTPALLDDRRPEPNGAHRYVPCATRHYGDDAGASGNRHSDTLYVFSRQFSRTTAHRARTLTLHLAADDCHRLGNSRRPRRCQSGKSALGRLFHAGRRRELLRSAVAAIRNLLAAAIVLDIVFQLILYHSLHPGAAWVVGPILICIPYMVSRSLTTRLACGMGKR